MDIWRRQVERRGAFSHPSLETNSGPHLDFSHAAGLAAADDFAHAGDANRLAWSDFLPTGTHRLWWTTFFYLEVTDNEAERRDTSSRAPFRKIDAGRLSDDEAGCLRRPAPGPFRANSACERSG